jgi:transposase
LSPILIIPEDITNIQGTGCAVLDEPDDCRSYVPNKLAQVESALIQGAQANGYGNDLWTLKRVAEVIQRVTGVSHHPARVWYILRQGLNWSWQRPARRATERNEEAIQFWVKRRWPRLKKGRGARTR